MKLALALALIAAVTGCQPKEPAAEGPVPQDYLDEKAACEAHGGRWGTGGAAGFFVCYETTRDGGRQCDAGSDCQGMCLARSRTCSPVTPLFGCQDILTDNGSQATICRD